MRTRFPLHGTSHRQRRWLLLGALTALVLGLGGSGLFGGTSARADSNTINFDSYTLGTINGQDGWSSTGPYDREVVTNGGGKALRISNAVTSGSFGDQTFSKSLVDEAGETSAVSGGMSGGTRQNRFESEFTLSSVVPGAQQAGLFMSVSPDRGDGARMSYLGFDDQADGIHVLFYDYEDAAPFGTFLGDATGCGAEDDFILSDIATLDRSLAHTVKFDMGFVDGDRNDVVKIYIDSSLVKTGTSWEDYFRYCEGNPTRPVDSLLFRTGGTAAPATAGNGYLIDDLTNTSSTTPSTTTTTTVTASSMTAAGWGFFDDVANVVDPTLGSFVTGPGTPPFGTGSVQISVTGSQRRNVATALYGGTPLANISTMRFRTYNPSAGNGGAATRSAYLNFNVDFNASNTYQNRLVYVPNQNGTVVQNAWQEWDTIGFGTALWSYSGPTWPTTGGAGTTPKTWSQILSDYPSIKMLSLYPFIGLRVGEPYPDGYTENLDTFTLGTAAGTTIFNFEDTPPCTTVCYVNGTTGNDAFDGSTATSAKKTIQGGVNAVSVGGTVNVAAGTYPEQVTVNADITLAGAGQSLTLITGSACTGNGIALGAGASGATIQDLGIGGFNLGIQILTGPLANITVQNVTSSNNCLHGIWVQAFGTTNFAFTQVTANSNGIGVGGRGIWMINGVKTDISITGGTFNSNGLVGIDISDGSVTGLTITGNTVTGNGDSGIGVLGAKGPGANLVANNIVTNNGRYGIEIKIPSGNGAASGPGSVVVKDNVVTRTVAATDARDYAGIAVFRRSVTLPINANQPSGVVVTGNTVSGFIRKPLGSTGDGFGIVVEGSGHIVTKNLVSGNNVGIQIQSGNTANVQSTPYFDRGDAAPSWALINRNSITGNTDLELRNVGAGLTDATCNWYGTAAGPTTLSGTFVTAPWLLTSNLNGPCSTTITVKPSNMNGWVILDDNGGGAGPGSFVTGPATPPLGYGSARLQLTNATAGWAFATGLAGTPLGNITALSYDTYRGSIDGGNNLAIALQLVVDYDLTDTSLNYQSRIVFEPYQTFPGLVPQGTWQSWDAHAGKWWQAAGGSFPARVGNVPVANVCPQATPCTLTALLAAYPNLGIHPTAGLGGVLLKAGSNWAGFDGNTDKLRMVVNGADVTYDFEPECSTDCYVRTDGNDANTGLANTAADAKKTIQAAVNAVSVGGTVHVAAGTYPEQVVITKSLLVDGAGKALTIVKPIGVVANTTRLNGSATAAIFDVENATGVNIQNLTADGSLNGILGCSPNMLGFYYKKASGNLTNVAASHIKLSPALFGCQTGVGVFVEADSPDIANVVVNNATITDYQKGGVVGNRTGTTISVLNSTVTGVGPTIQIAANGIQVGFGAKGTITNNDVSGNDYTPSTAAATGILLFQAATTSSVTGNNIHNNHEGLYIESSNGVIVNNNTFANTRDTAIYVSLSNNGTYTGNTVMGQPASTGMWVYDASANNSVTGNAFRNGDFGVIVDFTGTGTPAANQFNGNCLAGNIGAGMQTLGSLVGPKVNATANWWGRFDGPAPIGTGDSILPGDGSTIDPSGFLAAPVAGCPVPADADGDGLNDPFDNCPSVYNPSQTNTDQLNVVGNKPGSDALGDVCDSDMDGDGYTNTQETTLVKNPLVYCAIMRADPDGDGVISILDLSKVAQKFGLSVPAIPTVGLDAGIQRLNQDGDSQISILDLSRVALYFLQPVTNCSP